VSFVTTQPEARMPRLRVTAPAIRQLMISRYGNIQVNMGCMTDPVPMRIMAGRFTRHTCGLDRRRMSAAIHVIHVGPDMYSKGAQ
jgi:hypothetical protein